MKSLLYKLVIPKYQELQKARKVVVAMAPYCSLALILNSRRLWAITSSHPTAASRGRSEAVVVAFFFFQWALQGEICVKRRTANNAFIVIWIKANAKQPSVLLSPFGDNFFVPKWDQGSLTKTRNFKGYGQYSSCLLETLIADFFSEMGLPLPNRKLFVPRSE